VSYKNALYSKMNRHRGFITWLKKNKKGFEIRLNIYIPDCTRSDM